MPKRLDNNPPTDPYVDPYGDMPELLADDMSLRMGLPTYLGDPEQPYDPIYDLNIDPRNIDPTWLADDEVLIDFRTLDLDEFDYDDVMGPERFWVDWIGRALTMREKSYLMAIQMIREQRHNIGKQNPQQKDDSSF